MTSNATQIPMQPTNAGHSDEWLAQQRKAVEQHRKEQHVAWMKRHRCTVGTKAGEATPVAIRAVGFRDEAIGLVLLVNEAANYQWRRAAGEQILSREGSADYVRVRKAYAGGWEPVRNFVLDSVEEHKRYRTAYLKAQEEWCHINHGGGKAKATAEIESLRQHMNGTTPIQISKALASKRLFANS